MDDNFCDDHRMMMAFVDELKDKHKLSDEQLKAIYEGPSGLNSKVSYKLWNWSLSIITLIFVAIGGLLWSMSMTTTRIEANQITVIKGLDDIKKDMKEIQRRP